MFVIISSIKLINLKAYTTFFANRETPRAPPQKIGVKATCTVDVNEPTVFLWGGCGMYTRKEDGGGRDEEILESLE